MDGTGPVRLTADSDIDGLPVWAPDGETLIFVSNRDGEWGIWALNIEDYAMDKLFSLGGELDGVVRPDSSGGWTKETISWAP